MSERWDQSQIADIRGNTIIITGANNGIGFHTAMTLAANGAQTILAVRNMAKGHVAANQIITKYPQAKVHVMQLDLSDLESVHNFSNEFRERFNQINILLNNAGVMIPPYQKTKDGFELQFGCNHLGHFALTGLLLPSLLATPNSRVVTVSSIASRNGKIMFGNLDGSQGYRAFQFYAQSKLANLLFAKQLQLKLNDASHTTMSLMCHPGIANTNLMSRGSGKELPHWMKWLMGMVTQPAEMGALPLLYAATHPSVFGGESIGPHGPGGRRGYPIVDPSFDQLWDSRIALKLWDVSETLTGVTYKFTK
jgi:NAD(P)-dependent dehydrogenase (short-subunit alcohol dehydrogenase family)